MTKPRFCVKCGSPLATIDQFCGQCGQPSEQAVAGAAQPPTPQAAPPPYSAPPPPPAPSPPVAFTPPATQPAADILTVVAGLQRRSGFMGLKYDSFNLIVYAERLIFAAVSNKLASQAVKQARDQAKSQGKGFFGQWGAQMGWLQVLCDGYRTMSPAQILSTYPGSFALDNAHVRRIRLSEQEDDEDTRATTELRLETVGEKMRFTMSGNRAREIQQALASTLGHVLR